MKCVWSSDMYGDISSCGDDIRLITTHDGEEITYSEEVKEVIVDAAERYLSCRGLEDILSAGVTSKNVVRTADFAKSPVTHLSEQRLECCLIEFDYQLRERRKKLVLQLTKLRQTEPLQRRRYKWKLASGCSSTSTLPRKSKASTKCS